jgi:hypothetical protein
VVGKLSTLVVTMGDQGPSTLLVLSHASIEGNRASFADSRIGSGSSGNSMESIEIKDASLPVSRT